MTEDEIVTLGTFAEGVLTHDHFNRLVTEFEKSTCHQLLSTKPGQANQREHIFATFLGVQTFIGFLQQFVSDKAKIEAAAQDEAPEDDGDTFNY